MYIRNPEIRKYILIQIVVSSVLIFLAFIFSFGTGVIVSLTTIILNFFFFIYTANRYKSISNLCLYLMRISNGEYTLSLKDCEEGELSILKSEIFKVTQKLIEYAEQLKHEKLLLSTYLADISHQLKTPLTSMTLMCEILKDESLPEKDRNEFVECISTQLERIEWLVSALLKMSRLDAGVVVMKKESIYAINLIDKVLMPISLAAEFKNIEIIINLSQEISIKCDIQWTSEALINIVKNCIEHTPHNGTILISAYDTPLYCQITIEDNGCGIEKEDLPHIFTRFYRGKNSSNDSVGIGLAMARSIILNQQGDITIESKKNEGSKFIVRLYKTIV